MTKPVLTVSNLKVVAAVSCLALSLAVTIAGAAQAESLKDAIAMAYAQNPTLGRQRAVQRATDEGYVQARSGLGPSLSAGLEDDYSHLPHVLGGRTNEGSGALSLSQTLFTSGNLSAGVDAAKATVQSGQQTLRSAETTLILNVISVYTAVRRDQQALQISQDNRDILQKQFNQTNAQFQAGQLTKTDVSQSQARLSASEASLAQAQAQLDADRASYVAIVGQAPVALDPTPDLPGLPKDFDTALAAAQANNPDLQAALYAEDSAKARVTQARSAYGPSVSVSGTAGRIALDANHLGSTLPEETATLRLSVPLFTSGLTGSRVREALENYTAQKETTDITRRQVVSNVSQAWSQMIASKSGVTADQAQVSAAQIAADGLKTEQQVGLRTNIEVLNAEQDLKSAQLALVEAQRTQYVAASQLLSAMGSLTAKAFVPDLDVYDPQKNFNKVKAKGWTPLQPVVHVLDGAAASLIGGK